MVTRFYFATSDPAPVAVTASASWEQIGNAQNYKLRTYAASSRFYAGGAASAAKSSATTTWDILNAYFVTDPVKAGTLSGTFSLAAFPTQDLAANDMYMQVVIKVVSNNGVTVRGTAYAGQAATTVSATPSAPNAELSVTTFRSRYLKDIALTPVAMQDGDRIVVEMGVRSCVATSGGTSNFFWSDAEDGADLDFVADLLSSNFAVNNMLRPWIEFSADVFGTLAAEQFRFPAGGTLLNGDPPLPFVDITGIDGIDSAPVRLSTHDREGIHGGYVSSQFESTRTITIEGNIYASPSTLETYLDQLKFDFQPTWQTRLFAIGTDAGTRYVWAKSQGLRYKKDSFRRLGIVPFQVQLLAADPRLYSDMVTVMATATTGVTSTLLNNVAVGGNRDTPARIVITAVTGPITTLDLQIKNQYGLLYLQRNIAPSLAAGSTVVVLPDIRSMQLNYSNINDRGSWTFLSGPWMNLAPSNNLVTVNCSGGTYNVILQYRPAWR